VAIAGIAGPAARGGTLLVACFVAGLLSIGAQLCTVALIAGFYDTALRATGVGSSVGIGRIGGIVRPGARRRAGGRRDGGAGAVPADRAGLARRGATFSRWAGCALPAGARYGGGGARPGTR